MIGAWTLSTHLGNKLYELEGQARRRQPACEYSPCRATFAGHIMGTLSGEWQSQLASREETS